MSDVLRDDDTDPAGFGLLDPIVREAHRRFKQCEAWESVARARWRADVKFAEGDSDNGYQWPEDIYQSRVDSARPTLTINKVRQHNLQIINDAKQKKSGIKYRPVGGGATARAAEILEGITRHIQDVSLASIHRGTAIEFQVKAGLGFTRVVTDYEHDRTFDQEIYIRGIPNPLECYLDPYCQELDASDARYGFVFADRPRDAVLAEHPELKDRLSTTNAVDRYAGWVREKTVRECEYYWLEDERDQLIGKWDGTTILKSQINAELLKAWTEETEANGETLRVRDLVRKQLKWAKIIGTEVVDEKDLPGRSIPIVPWVGEQTCINNVLDRKGHTRALKDAQRMLNYNRSAAVEYGALQSKSPWIADVRAIEGNETLWESANLKNHAVLAYKGVDDDGNEIRPPTRQDPPQSAPVFAEGSTAAERDMMVASGQYEAQMGAPSNEVSGRAINERQRQGDRATYHFIDAQAIAIRREGQILLELIPEVYDTARLKRILGEDGTEDQIAIDPRCDGACMQQDDGSVVFNPRVGQYAVVSDVGPDFATQRQEAFNAIVQILTQAPQLIDRVGDLLFKVADFPLAEQFAERLQPKLPPEAEAQIQTLQEQLQKLTAAGANTQRLLQEAMQSLTEERLKTKAKDQDAIIDAFDADTRRVTALKDYLPMTPEALQAFVMQTVRQAMQDNLGPAVMSAQPGLQLQAAGQELPGATGAVPVTGVPGGPGAALVPNPGQQAATPGGM